MAKRKTVHASKTEQKKRMIDWYVKETSDVDIDMDKVARWAHARGWPLPAPVDPIQRLAKEFSQAAREVHETDAKTGKSYRKYHAITQGSGSGQTTFWVDIDHPKTTRGKMHKSVTQRREQMVGDGLQLSLDVDHWNSFHPNVVEQIEIDLDLTLDVEWRKNAPDEDEEKVG
jgi:hypothetical protein